jgi:hypothetical protein
MPDANSLKSFCRRFVLFVLKLFCSLFSQFEYHCCLVAQRSRYLASESRTSELNGSLSDPACFISLQIVYGKHSFFTLK